MWAGKSCFDAAKVIMQQVVLKPNFKLIIFSNEIRPCDAGSMGCNSRL